MAQAVEGRKKGRFYGCSYYKTRGSPICKNSLLVEQELLDYVVLKTVSDVLKGTDGQAAMDKALIKLRAGRAAQLDPRITIDPELWLICEEEHSIDAIAEGNKDRGVRTRLKEQEGRRQALIGEVYQFSAVDDVADLNEVRLKRDLTARLADTQVLLRRHIWAARRLLRTLTEHAYSAKRCERHR